MQQAIDSMITFIRNPNMLDRLGLCDPTRNKCLTVAATFHAYHAVKRGPQLNPHQPDANLRTFVDAFHVACSESGLAIRAIPRVDLAG